MEDPRREARILLAETLGVSQTWMLAHPDGGVPSERQRVFLAAVERRAAREPFAYIVGHREFHGLDLEVSPAVLIPRPETELLVELALREARRLAVAKGRPLLIADLGTGSGAVAISLATRLSDCRVVAVDTSTLALEIARKNAARHGVASRIEFRESDLLRSVPESLDLVVGNLPYISSDEVERLMPEVSGYEPRAALDGGPDGTAIVTEALSQASERIDMPAAILFEIGDDQGETLSRYARGVYSGATVRVDRDYAGLDRVLWVQVDRRP